jgi:hypothetical protein
MNAFHSTLKEIFDQIDKSLPDNQQSSLFSKFIELVIDRIRPFDHDQDRINRVKREVKILIKLNKVDLVTNNFAMFKDFDDFSYAYFLLTKLIRDDNKMDLNNTTDEITKFALVYSTVINSIHL